jgi:hypothetical protein
VLIYMDGSATFRRLGVHPRHLLGQTARLLQRQIAMRYFMAVLVCLRVAAGESIGVGIKIGVPLTETFQAGSGPYRHGYFSSSSKTRRYTLGLAATIPLPARFGVEIDGLYRRVNYDWSDTTYVSAGDGGVIYSWSSTAGNRLDLPVLLRWSPGRRLYVIGGAAFAAHYGFDQRTHTIQDLQIAGYSDRFTTTSEPFARRVSKGATLGLGFDAPVGRVHVKPEARYTHWISPAFDRNIFLQPVTNEIEFLLGVEFGGGR